jgi:hypothetical protein
MIFYVLAFALFCYYDWLQYTFTEDYIEISKFGHTKILEGKFIAIVYAMELFLCGIIILFYVALAQRQQQTTEKLEADFKDDVEKRLLHSDSIVDENDFRDKNLIKTLEDQKMAPKLIVNEFDDAINAFNESDGSDKTISEDSSEHSDN